ncbi:MAG: hypothetical protein IT427_17715 [Pirellulales bacterium]|nr:hypothetical protein [Pirellulales bacterium]
MLPQNWQKRGVAYCPPTLHPWIVSHAQVPTPYLTAAGDVRIYFGARSEQNRTATIFLELDKHAVDKIRFVHDRPVLPLGDLGCFDDAGVMPSCLVRDGTKTYLYYTGWNTSTTVPYRNSIGMAISDDDGVTFWRPFSGPLLDRVREEPHFCATPFVMRDGGVWRMWYLSCTEWVAINSKPEARYLIRHTESNDGLEWRRPGTIAVNYQRPDEAIARPWIIKDASGYRMWYCYRSIRGYREDSQKGYRVGYATSADGLVWKRRDELVELPRGDGWDASMNAYPAVFDLGERRYMLYNGNGFGATGFGFAELSQG